MSRFNKTKKNLKTVSLECHNVTYHGIHYWYKSKFEKLGWMILAKKYGHNDKVMEYKNSIKRLQCSIEKKIKDIRDVDKKNDLKIMLENLDFLMEHVEKDFP